MFEKAVQFFQAHLDQFRSRIEPEDIKIKEESGNEEQEEPYDIQSKIDQSRDKTKNKQLEETEKENELTPESSKGETTKDAKKKNSGS